MLKVTVFLSLLLSASVFANCIGEAQLIGQVESIKKTLTSCRVFLTRDSWLQSSLVCPIDESKLQLEGIEVGIINGHDCPYEAGAAISGIVVDKGHVIVLE